MSAPASSSLSWSWPLWLALTAVLLLAAIARVPLASGTTVAMAPFSLGMIGAWSLNGPLGLQDSQASDSLQSNPSAGCAPSLSSASSLPNGAPGLPLQSLCSSFTLLSVDTWPSSFTFSLWFSINTQAQGARSTYALLSGASLLATVVPTVGQQQVTLSVEQGGSAGVTVTGTVASSCVGVWCHIAYSYNASTHECYLYGNGALIGGRSEWLDWTITSTVADAWASGSHTALTVGVASSTTSFVGRLYSLRLWDLALSMTQAVSVFATESNQNPWCQPGFIYSAATYSMCLPGACANGVASSACLGCQSLNATAFTCTGCSSAAYTYDSTTQQCTLPTTSSAPTVSPTTVVPHNTSLFSRLAPGCNCSNRAYGNFTLPRPALLNVSAASVSMAVGVVDNPSGFKLGPQFHGVAFESTALQQGNLFTPSNCYMLGLFHLLGGGVVRVGGLTISYLTWSNVTQLDVYNTLTLADMEALAGFMQILPQWQVLLGVPITNTPAQQLDMVNHAAQLLGSSLYAIQIGNEPSDAGNTPTEWANTVINGMKAIRSNPANAQVKLDGPALDRPAESWIEEYVDQADGYNQILDVHCYMGLPFGYPSTASPLGLIQDALPSGASSVAGWAVQVQQMGQLLNEPTRAGEVASYGAGGYSGLTNTMAGAFWQLNAFMTFAQYGVSGGNMQTGAHYGAFSTNSIGNPIYVFPQLYASMVQQELSAGGATLASISYPTSTPNFAAYASKAATNNYTVVLCNWDALQTINANLSLPTTGAVQYTVAYLTAPALSDQEDVLFAGAPVSTEGIWQPTQIFALPLGATTVFVPAMSMAVVRAEPHYAAPPSASSAGSSAAKFSSSAASSSRAAASSSAQVSSSARPSSSSTPSSSAPGARSSSPVAPSSSLRSSSARVSSSALPRSSSAAAVTSSSSARPSSSAAVTFSSSAHSSSAAVTLSSSAHSSSSSPQPASSSASAHSVSSSSTVAVSSPSAAAQSYYPLEQDLSDPLNPQQPATMISDPVTCRAYFVVQSVPNGTVSPAYLNSCLHVAVQTAIIPADSFSVASWFKVLNSTYASAVSSLWGGGFTLTIAGNALFHFTLGGVNVLSFTYNTTALTTFPWFHAAIAYNATTQAVSVYINAQPVVQQQQVLATAVTSWVASDHTAIMLGAYVTGYASSSLVGGIYHHRYINATVDGAAVQAWYEADLGAL